MLKCRDTNGRVGKVENQDSGDLSVVETLAREPGCELVVSVDARLRARSGPERQTIVDRRRENRLVLLPIGRLS